MYIYIHVVTYIIHVHIYTCSYLYYTCSYLFFHSSSIRFTTCMYLAATVVSECTHSAEPLPQVWSVITIITHKKPITDNIMVLKIMSSNWLFYEHLLYIYMYIYIYMYMYTWFIGMALQAIKQYMQIIMSVWDVIYYLLQVTVRSVSRITISDEKPVFVVFEVSHTCFIMCTW